MNLYQYAPNPITWIDPLGLWSFYQLINSTGEVVYYGITDRSVQTRVMEHASNGKVFSQVNFVDNISNRVSVRNLEGSVLYHAFGDTNLSNAIRKDGGFWHSYNPNKLADGRTLLSQTEINKTLSSGSSAKVDSNGKFTGKGAN